MSDLELHNVVTRLDERTIRMSKDMSEMKDIIKESFGHANKRINEVEEDANKRIDEVEDSVSKIQTWINVINGQWKLLVLLGAGISGISGVIGYIINHLQNHA